MAEGDITVNNVDSLKDVTKALNEQGEAGRNAANVLEGFSFVTNNVKTGLASLNDRLSLARAGLANLSNPGSAAASQFGLLATSIIGATESFKSLNNVDTSGISTFSRTIRFC